MRSNGTPRRRTKDDGGDRELSGTIVAVPAVSEFSLPKHLLTIYLIIFLTVDVEASLSKETLILSFMTSFCRFIYKNIYISPTMCAVIFGDFLFYFPKA